MVRLKYSAKVTILAFKSRTQVKLPYCRVQPTGKAKPRSREIASASLHTMRTRKSG